LVDFLVFELGDLLVVLSSVGSVVVLSFADSLEGDFSVFGSDFFELLFFSLLVFGLVALSAAGLLVVVEDFVDGEGLIAGTGLGFTVELAAGVVVAATEAEAEVAGVIVAAGLALALVEAALLVVVPVVVVPVVVVAFTPNVVGTLTP
jgi:hypothetical protein